MVQYGDDGGQASLPEVTLHQVKKHCQEIGSVVKDLGERLLAAEQIDGDVFPDPFG